MDELNLLRVIKILSIKVDKEINRILEKNHITSSQSMAMFYLFHHKNKEVSPIDIEKKFNLSHPTILGILKRLSEKGFIRIEKSSKDSRFRIVTLTKKGIEIEKEITLAFENIENRIINALSMEDYKKIKEISLKLVDEFKNGGC